MTRPWEVGGQHERWAGYLLDDRRTLRNLVGAEDPYTLREREDRRVEARALTLRENDLPRSYDLDGLREIHHHLFQDVYEWAGEVRTVDMEKNGRRFLSVGDIETAMSAVGDIVKATNGLSTIPDGAAYSGSLARLYHVVNWAHPFREGNGRTQREFFTALARETGHELDWTSVKGYANDRVSVAAIDGDIEPMIDMFDAITTRPPADQSRAVSAALTRGSAAGRESGYAPPANERSATYRTRAALGYER